MEDDRNVLIIFSKNLVFNQSHVEHNGTKYA